MKKKITGSFKSKTMILSAIISLMVPILAAFPILKNTLADNYEICFFLLSITVGILRHFTTKPVDKL